MSKNNERMRILEMIESREITPEEGRRKLDELTNRAESHEAKPLDRMEILEKIEAGEYSPEEGARRLKGDQLRGEESEAWQPAEYKTKSQTMSDEDLDKWKRWWQYPLWVGIGIVLLSGLWMNAAYQASGASLWFYCSWVPLLLGVALIFLSNQGQRGRWMHIRVKQAPGESPRNIALSFPLPIRLTSWALRNFGHNIPNLDKTSVDEILLAIDTHSNSDSPVYIHVDEGDEGEQVEVVIG